MSGIGSARLRKKIGPPRRGSRRRLDAGRSGDSIGLGIGSPPSSAHAKRPDTGGPAGWSSWDGLPGLRDDVQTSGLIDDFRFLFAVHRSVTDHDGRRAERRGRGFSRFAFRSRFALHGVHCFTLHDVDRGLIFRRARTLSGLALRATGCTLPRRRPCGPRHSRQRSSRCGDRRVPAPATPPRVLLCLSTAGWPPRC